MNIFKRALTAHTRPGYALLAAIYVVGLSLCQAQAAATPKKKPAKVAATTQTADTKPASTSVVAVHKLPNFCVDSEPGRRGRATVQTKPQNGCPKNQVSRPGTNAQEIVDALAPATEFTLKASGPNMIIVFQNAASGKADVPALLTTIDALAKPEAKELALTTVYTLKPTCVSPLESRQPCVILPGSNAQTIAGVLAKDPNFTVTADSPFRLVIACQKATGCAASDLEALERTIDRLAEPTASFVKDLEVAKGMASAVASSISNWNAQGITADAVGDSHVRLKSQTPINSTDLYALESQIRDYGFGHNSPPLLQQIFYSSAGDVVQGLNGAAATPTSPNMTPPNTTSNAPNTQAAGASSTGLQSIGAAPSAATGGGSPGSSGSGSGGSGASANSGGSGSGAVASSGAGGTTASSGSGGGTGSPANAAAGSANSGGNSGSGSGGAAPSTGGSGSNASASSGPNTGTTAPPGSGPASASIGAPGMAVVNDNVVFTDSSDDSATWRRVRLLSLIDLPRPEVFINMWSVQATSKDGQKLLDATNQLRDSVAQYNDRLNRSIEFGWAYISRQLDKPRTNPDQPFLDPSFYNYITQKFLSDTPACEDLPFAERAQSTCVSSEERKKWGFCPAGTYCLGFTNAFQPQRPTLSHILLTMIAANTRVSLSNEKKGHDYTSIFQTIACMEGKYEVISQPGNDCFPLRTEMVKQLQNVESTNACSSNETNSTCVSANKAVPILTGCDVVCKLRQARQKALDELSSKSPAPVSCETLDIAALMAEKVVGVEHSFPLSCFTIQAARSFADDPSFATFNFNQLNVLGESDLSVYIKNVLGAIKEEQKQPYRMGRQGLFRAAIAEFLYNYKMSIQYPLEFDPHRLQQSAQELNAQLNPLVVAFNQDVAAASRFMIEELRGLGKGIDDRESSIFGNKAFVSDGLITVRGISGVESLVDTQTQNFFNATEAPNLKDVLTALGTSSSPNLFKGAASYSSIATVAAALTPTPMQSKIGRQLELDITPHSLPGASSAELDVKLWAQEDAPPTKFATGSAPSSGNEDALSRIGRFNVSTKVRVESVKLFEISSFSAKLQRPRKGFPLLLPFVELPYVGSLLRWPLAPAEVYHRGTAIVSTLIVPNAADLAIGLEFTGDRGVIARSTNSVPADQGKSWRYKPGRDFKLRRLTSRKQLPDLPIDSFHKATVACFGAKLPFPSTLNVRAAGEGSVQCNQVDFSTVPPEF